MLTRVREIIKKHRLLLPGQRIVVGFSGGIDSVCLLHLLHSLTEYHLELIALYINHCLRPEENEQEVQLLQDYGVKLGIETKQVKVDIPARLQAKPQSLELLAREERYKIFRTVRQQVAGDKVALAHHRDDQAETILFRLIRGTGIRGLAGIPIKREAIFIRPLLEFSRAEIAAYVAEHQLDWVEDSSNHKLIYQRNKLRHGLIPQIEAEYNPRFREALARLGQLVAQQQDFMEQILDSYQSQMVVVMANRCGLELEPFLGLHPYVQFELLRRIMGGFGTGYTMETYNMQRFLDKIMAEGFDFKRVNVIKGVVVYCEASWLWFQKDAEPSCELDQKSYELTVPGISEFAEIGWEFQVQEAHLPEDWSKVSANTVYVDAASLSLPLILRFWKPGDIFWPFGCIGRQKLQDFFTNCKISRTLRGKIPLLVAADGRIVWVVGQRLSEEFKVISTTENIWRITAQTRLGD